MSTQQRPNASTMSAQAPPADPRPPAVSRRILVLGATGAIGQATMRALVNAGHDVVCFVRPGPDRSADMFSGAEARFGDATDPEALVRNGFCGERFDAVVSCMASRTGAPKDAWAVDHQAHVHALNAAKDT
jgi:divinyl chlorophyllide a 8-vinyl-reductase